jgi:hypothetical protein
MEVTARIGAEGSDAARAGVTGGGAAAGATAATFGAGEGSGDISAEQAATTARHRSFSTPFRTPRPAAFSAIDTLSEPVSCALMCKSAARG